MYFFGLNHNLDPFKVDPNSLNPFFTLSAKNDLFEPQSWVNQIWKLKNLVWLVTNKNTSKTKTLNSINIPLHNSWTKNANFGHCVAMVENLKITRWLHGA